MAHVSSQLQLLIIVVRVATVIGKQSSKCQRFALKTIVQTGREPQVPKSQAPAIALEIGVGPAIDD